MPNDEHTRGSGVHQACHLVGIGTLVPVLAEVNGSAPLDSSLHFKFPNLDIVIQMFFIHVNYGGKGIFKQNALHVYV